MKLASTRAYLVRRQGLVFLDDVALGTATAASRNQARAIGLELAALGFVPTQRLSDALACLDAAALASVHAWICATHAELAGANHDWLPLFYTFPDDVPADTTALWWDRVLVHYLQEGNQPCLFCKTVGTTHVLDPCGHVVCATCWDPAAYTACPICGGKLAEGSPFLAPKPAPKLGAERFPLRLLDLGTSLEDAVRAQFLAFCARKQAMSPDDVAGLRAIVTEMGVRVQSWLPADPKGIPVRENVARIFGALFQRLPADAVLSIARDYLRSATDVLRVLAAASDVDPALQAVPTAIEFRKGDDLRRWDKTRVAKGLALPWTRAGTAGFVIQKRRFVVRKLGRPTRRALLGLLDAMKPDALAEDMLRHRAAWVGAGEVLHPHDYASRFPNAARAFSIVRGKTAEGVPAPPFQTYAARVGTALEVGDINAAVALLRERPGELARRYDHLLRIATKPREQATVVTAFTELVAKISTPVLLALRNVLPTRRAASAVRVYWPKGAVARGVHARDDRPPIASDAIAKSRRVIDAELLARFAALPPYADAILDEALHDVVVPFNERTSSRSAMQVPRGTRLLLPESKHVRLFLHWCEPEKGRRTDLDLSVAFYDAGWKHVATCSYYELTCSIGATRIAVSSGDFTSAPFPNGASEFVDLDRAAARAAGVRYAVMVVNAYAGMTFSELAHGFAGLMLRDALQGAHFDPRTVELKFDLQGEHGVFMPLVIDLETDEIHWLDVYDPGRLHMNNVQTSSRAIATICPNLIAYFASGTRSSMFELVALHVAARTPRVTLRKRDGALVQIERGDDSVANYLARIAHATGSPARQLPSGPVLAGLLRGDVPIVEGSTMYALIREQASPLVAGSSFIV